MAQPDLEQNIVYKIVRNRGGRSLSALIEDPSWEVTYVRNEPARPIHPHSPLFAFRDLETAIRWVGGNNHIWKAQAEGIKNPLQDIPQPTDTKAFAGFWRNRWLHLPLLVSHNGGIPLGTVFCRSITLLEEVA